MQWGRVSISVSALLLIANQGFQVFSFLALNAPCLWRKAWPYDLLWFPSLCLSDVPNSRASYLCPWVRTAWSRAHTRYTRAEIQMYYFRPLRFGHWWSLQPQLACHDRHRLRSNRVWLYPQVLSCRAKGRHTEPPRLILWNGGEKKSRDFLSELHE